MDPLNVPPFGPQDMTFMRPPSPPPREPLHLQIGPDQLRAVRREIPPLHPLDRTEFEDPQETIEREWDLSAMGFDTDEPMRFEEVYTAHGPATLVVGVKRPPGAPRQPRKERDLSGPVNIAGLDKAAVLAALVNAARTGLPKDFGPLVRLYTWREADSLIRAHGLRFDYVAARPIKADLSGDTFDPRLYDRDSGPGQAARAIARLRKEHAGG